LKWLDGRPVVACRVSVASAKAAAVGAKAFSAAFGRRRLSFHMKCGRERAQDQG
jgi:hypothetical protein